VIAVTAIFVLSSLKVAHSSGPLLPQTRGDGPSLPQRGEPPSSGTIQGDCLDSETQEFRSYHGSRTQAMFKVCAVAQLSSDSNDSGCA
jgi:hypothetical protein